MNHTVAIGELDRLTERLGTVDCFVLGEMHGINENAVVLERLVEVAERAGIPVSVGLEWDLRRSPAFQSFILGSGAGCAVPGFIGASDGRCTAAHIALLQALRERNLRSPQTPITVFGFDVPDADGYERAMAERIEAERPPNTLAVVATGVVHARRHQSPPSLVDELARRCRVANAFLAYEAGTVMVEGNEYPVSDAYQQQRGPAADFDHVITVPLATPAAEVDALTAAQDFFTVEEGRASGRTREETSP